MDKEKKNNGKKKLIITMAVALILLVGVTVSYGYIAILGNSKNQEVSVGTGDIHLVFDDADTDNVNATLKLGESITKTFKIENKGTKPGKVQINWKNLVNTYNSRSLSYTLETSSSKDTGYTKIEALRENVPVSTEAKEVPLSNSITVPVQSAPIYYRVTITFNDLEDVDQSGDLSATLSTQFSLSEPENLSKKVIAVLDGNVKMSDPDLINPSPKYIINSYRNGMTSKDITAEHLERYIIYGDDYKTDNKGKLSVTNAQSTKYKDVYSNLAGKYLCIPRFATSAIQDTEPQCSNKDYIYRIISASQTKYVYEELRTEKKRVEPEEFSYQDTYEIGTNGSKNIYYADSYTFNGLEFELVNPISCAYSSCYQNLKGKYVIDLYPDYEEGQMSYEYGTSLYKIISASSANITYDTKIFTEGTPILDYSTSGVYKAEDDYGDSYYYRGGVDNNYFKFANSYWRIMRVNGDGSIRMQYAGPKAFKNGEYSQIDMGAGGGLKLTNYAAGYMIGIDESTTTLTTSKEQADTNTYDSPLKSAVDTWYENHLSSYASYLSDTLFCSDRSVAPSANTWETSDTALGYGNNQTVYGSYNRIQNTKPSLKCPLKNDRFTVNDTKIGNGALKYPIALITGDELMFGGVSLNPVLSTGYDYLSWDNYYSKHTMSPALLVGGSTVEIRNVYRNAGGTAINFGSHYAVTVALPVINISSEYALNLEGNGTMTDPFMIPGVN